MSMNPQGKPPESEFTYRAFGIGALIGVVSYIAFRDVPDVLDFVELGTWAVPALMTLLIALLAVFARNRLSNSTKSLIVDTGLEAIKVVAGHGLMFVSLYLLHLF